MDAGSKTSPSTSSAAALYTLGGTVLLILIVGCLYTFDTAPWPTIGVACLSYVYAFFALHLVSDRGRDVHLSYFLTSQLFLACFSKYDPHKGPDGDGPISSSATYLKTNAHLRLGLAQLVESHYLLKTIENVCVVSWIMAIVLSLVYSKERVLRGWINKTIFTVLCLSYFFLHGIMAGLNGVSHRFYLPAYSFATLLLEVLLNIDSHPYVCIFAGFTFVSAGISKLRNSSLTWLNGRALCRHIRKDSNDTFFGAFCSTMAPLSVFFEVMAPQLMFFGSTGRILFVLLALSFHLGIAILMFPRYTPQACSYALIFRTNLKKPKWPILLGVVCAILVATTMFRIESWPLTAVPMYSIDVEGDFGSTLQEAYRVAHIIDTTSCSSGIAFPDRYLYVETDPSFEPPEGCSLINVGKIKLVKQFLIRGLASALVCMETSCSHNGEKNFWFDKYSMAIHEKCQIGFLRFSLILRDNGDRHRHNGAIPVYTWKAPLERLLEEIKPEQQQQQEEL